MMGMVMVGWRGGEMKGKGLVMNVMGLFRVLRTARLWLS